MGAFVAFEEEALEIAGTEVTRDVQLRLDLRWNQIEVRHLKSEKST